MSPRAGARLKGMMGDSSDNIPAFPAGIKLPSSCWISTVRWTMCRPCRRYQGKLGDMRNMWSRRAFRQLATIDRRPLRLL